MTRLLAVDPGGTSGWAESTLQNPAADLTYGQYTPSEMAARLRLFCAQSSFEERVLLMERFTITVKTGKNTQQTDALELIGLGRYLAEWHGVEFELQSPGDAKGFATNPQLKKWGVWVPVQDHARDAVRHLVLGCAKRGVFLFD